MDRFSVTSVGETGTVNRTVDVPEVTEEGTYVRYRVLGIDSSNNEGAWSSAVTVAGPAPPFPGAGGISSALMWGLIGGGIALAVIILVIILICCCCPEGARRKKRQATNKIRNAFSSSDKTSSKTERSNYNNNNNNTRVTRVTNATAAPKDVNDAVIQNHEWRSPAIIETVDRSSARYSDHQQEQEQKRRYEEVEIRQRASVPGVASGSEAGSERESLPRYYASDDGYAHADNYDPRVESAER